MVTPIVRILYFHQHFHDGRPYWFPKLLAERGHQVTLVCCNREYSDKHLPVHGISSRANLDGIDVIQINVRYDQTMSFARRIWSFLAFAVLASWYGIKLRRYDVVFASSTPLTIAIPGLIASFWHRRPFVFEVRDLWPAVPIELGILRNKVLIWLAMKLETFAYVRARQIVALSLGMKEYIVSSGIPESKITVIPNSSDIEEFKVPSEEGRAFRETHKEIGDRPLLVYSGTHGMVNNLEWAVDLAVEMKKLDPSVCFLLIGRGNEKEMLISKSREAKVLGENIFFYDRVPRKELPRVLSAADICAGFVIAHPILRLNSSNKIFDALAAGKPIVINYGGWQADLINETGCGLVLERGDLPSAARNLHNAITDKDWLSKAGAAAARLAIERFDRRDHVTTLEKVLQKALELN